ncbi:MAG: mannitol dehydrogenase family protein [Planktomarina sp.]
MTDQRPLVRIVHLGLGAFFRAHACTYLQDIGGWGVLGISLRSPAVRDALQARDYRYTAAALTPDGVELREIDVVRRVLVAPEDPVAVIAAMADPAVSIVSLTVTEKGYCHDPATGALNLDHPVIQADIENPLPQSAPGFVVRGLQARRAKGLHPFTVMSCDNLPDNGALIRKITIDLARLIDPALAEWITIEGAFPTSMVDRIVPATTPEDVIKIATISGKPDAAPVLHEPFKQWVITDDFTESRPDFETAGVQITRNIEPFENMKLRTLNGAHSAIAYLGLLSGFKAVADAVADPTLATYLTHLWENEIIPTLTAPPDTDLKEYTAALLIRFANTGIQHQLSQIGMDGSQKLPQRFLGTIRDQLDRNGDVSALLLAVAAWIKYTSNVSECDDPMAKVLRKCHMPDPKQTVANILAQRAIFPQDIALEIQRPLKQIYAELSNVGASEMLKQYQPVRQLHNNAI